MPDNFLVILVIKTACDSAHRSSCGLPLGIRNDSEETVGCLSGSQLFLLLPPSYLFYKEEFSRG